MGFYEELKKALDNANNEREIGAFLKKKLSLIRELNEHSWNCVITKAEFNIGVKYRADFVVLSACSGYWNCVLIEMQSPKDRIFNQKGEALQGLREAQRQVQDWDMWIKENEVAFRQQLAELAKGKHSQCSNVSLHQLAETELRDLKTTVRYKYKILIGRRDFLKQEDNKRRSQFTDFEIVTFDRLLDYAKRCDENDTLTKRVSEKSAQEYYANEEAGK